MPKLFNRVASLTIGIPNTPGIVITHDSLRFEFQIKTPKSNKPTTAEITVYNPSKKTVDAILTMGKKADVILDAGYQDLHHVIHRASVTQMLQRRSGPDRMLIITTGDGAREMASVKAQISQAGKVDPNKIIAQLAGKLGTAVGEIKTMVTDGIKNGFSFEGLAKDALTKLTNSMGADWYVQNNTLHVLPKGGYLSTTAYVLNENTGLIGTPSITEDGYKFECLLIPDICKGRRVILDSEFIKATCVAQRVDITGDTGPSGAWKLSIEATKL